MTPSESSNAAAAAGPIDMTAGVNESNATAPNGSVRQIPLGRSAAVASARLAGAATEVAAVAVPLPRPRPERAVAEATPSQGSLAEMESTTARPMAADPDPELVARVERALAEAPPDPVATPPVAMPPVAMPSAAPARAAEPAAVFAGAEQAPSDTTPLPAGIKLPPAEIPFAPTGSV
jgi:fused signal recognition particle receptor